MNDTVKRLPFDLTVWTVSIVAGLALLAHEAMAGHDFSSARNARWQAECGACHVAYPPQLLPAPAWHRVMARLDRHFGTDASLDPGAAAEIGAFLERHAARTSRDTASGRITDTGWFVREHDEVPAATWRSAAVKSPANCAACHRRAEQGDFGERSLRLPR
ncbi:MAG: diheme cytochrome c [Betaproteobacteria bacterium]|nr:diheme cytochrome c [Betaproteobacteria bacterium]